MYSFFKQHGDKVLALATVALLAMGQDAKGLGLNEVAVHWVALGTAFATAAHTLFYPNSQTSTKETSK